MSMLIRGMKMPEHVGCYLLTIFYDASGNMCAYPLEMMNGYDSRDLLKNTTEFPLVEVPTPHGRLIDTNWIADYVVDFIEEDRDGAYLKSWTDYDVLDMIVSAPTIIEAEGEEEDEI